MDCTYPQNEIPIIGLGSERFGKSSAATPRGGAQDALRLIKRGVHTVCRIISVAWKGKPGGRYPVAENAFGGASLTIKLVKPSSRRRAEFLAAAARSHKLHRMWTAPPRTKKEFEEYLKRLDSPAHAGYWILTEAGDLAGVVNVNEIVRGRFRSGYLGYYGFAPHAGRGYMTEGLRAAINKVFRSLKLHRLEANIQPNNERSRRLVQRLGFRLEGYSPRYLKIAGRWRDHERWAITVEEWTAAARPGRQSR